MAVAVYSVKWVFPECHPRSAGLARIDGYGYHRVTEIAYLVDIVGLSFAKGCYLVNFFQNLRLTKSQANTLLYQLVRDWEREFDWLCKIFDPASFAGIPIRDDAAVCTHFTQDARVLGSSAAQDDQAHAAGPEQRGIPDLHRPTGEDLLLNLSRPARPYE